MKILILTPWYPDEQNPNHGIFIRDQAVALAREHTVYVLSSKVDYHAFGLSSWKMRVAREGPLSESRLVVKKSLPVFNQFNYFWITIRESRAIVRSMAPDVIYSNIGYPGAFWGWCLSRLTGVRWVFSEHTLLHNNFRSVFHRWMTISFVRRADAVITVSRHSAAMIQKYTGRDAVVVPNIIRFDLFREIHPVPGPKVHIGFLGSSFFRKKGLNLLLRSLSGVTADFVLHIGGNDPELDMYRKQAEELGLASRCIWHGAVVHSEVPAFMARLNFFVSASVFESFGMAIAEAMACGLPVVSTCSGGPADFVHEGNGILVPNQDHLALRAALQRMLVSWSTYDRQRIRGEVVERFSAQSFVAKVLPVLHG